MSPRIGRTLGGFHHRVAHCLANMQPMRTGAGTWICYDVIADKNAVTKIMSNSIGLQHIEFNGFAKRHWQSGYYPVAYGWCLGLCLGLGLYL